MHDFLYLRIDFEKGTDVGYAFVKLVGTVNFSVTASLRPQHTARLSQQHPNALKTTILRCARSSRSLVTPKFIIASTVGAQREPSSGMTEVTPGTTALAYGQSFRHSDAKRGHHARAGYCHDASNRIA